MRSRKPTEITEASKQRQVRTGMVEITPARAAILALSDVEICRLHDDDSESLIETLWDLLRAIREGDQLGIWFEDDPEASGLNQQMAVDRLAKGEMSGDQNAKEPKLKRARQIAEEERQPQKETDLDLGM